MDFQGRVSNWGDPTVCETNDLKLFSINYFSKGEEEKVQDSLEDKSAGDFYQIWAEDSASVSGLQTLADLPS